MYHTTYGVLYPAVHSYVHITEQWLDINAQYNNIHDKTTKFTHVQP